MWILWGWTDAVALWAPRPRLLPSPVHRSKDAPNHPTLATVSRPWTAPPHRGAGQEDPPAEVAAGEGVLMGPTPRRCAEAPADHQSPRSFPRGGASAAPRAPYGRRIPALPCRPAPRPPSTGGRSSITTTPQSSRAAAEPRAREPAPRARRPADTASTHHEGRVTPRADAPQPAHRPRSRDAGLKQLSER